VPATVTASVGGGSVRPRRWPSRYRCRGPRRQGAPCHRQRPVVPSRASQAAGVELAAGQNTALPVSQLEARIDSGVVFTFDFSPTDLPAVTALVLAELYRRDNGWRIRARRTGLPRRPCRPRTGLRRQHRLADGEAATACGPVCAAMAYNLTGTVGVLASTFHATATTGTIRAQLINVPGPPARRPAGRPARPLRPSPRPAPASRLADGRPPGRRWPRPPEMGHPSRPDPSTRPSGPTRSRTWRPPGPPGHTRTPSGGQLLRRRPRSLSDLERYRFSGQGPY